MRNFVTLVIVLAVTALANAQIYDPHYCDSLPSGGSDAGNSLSGYYDADGDGYGTGPLMCFPPGDPNRSFRNDDCDDNNPDIYPRGFPIDKDGDGYGTRFGRVFCRDASPPPGHAIKSGDCDDNNIDVNPDTVWYLDTDGDGLGVTGSYDKKQCEKPPDESNGTYVVRAGDLCPNIYSPLQGGCTNIIQPLAANDTYKNYLRSAEYDIDAKIKQNSITYYDVLGRALQSQSLDPNTGQLWATQTLYDSEGRPALSSFGAPIGINHAFEYDPNFIAKPNGRPYTKSDFESDKESPMVVGEYISTLGWYYSGNNDREPYQDVTDYPFLRTIYSTLQPNTPLKTIGGNKINGVWPQAYSFSMKASEELSQTPAFGNSVYNTIKTLKAVTRDVHGVENVVFADSDGLVLATARSGGPLSRSMSISIGEQGYTDIHVPEGNTMGFTVETQGNSVTVYDLITETTVTPSKSLPNGFYRVAVDDTENYIAGSVIVTYQENYYDYALNEYDPAGRLVASYQPLGNALQQKPKTTYAYNALGQLIYSNSPDEGQAWFKYRKDGQIRYSQNSEQKSRNAFSYTNYDNLGRPVESGVVENEAFNTIDPNDATEGTPEGLKKEQLYTHYDEPLKTSNCTDPICTTVAQRGGQKYVRSNVSSTQNSQSTTYYSYDIYGRVEWIVQDLLGVGIKTIDYTYHPISGLVTQITYQKEAVDQFIHRYTYNILDQLTQVETSTKGTTYQTQAEYTYYESGELKRVQLADGAQGLDYVYNLNGQLKSINHPSLLSTDDPGGDSNDLFGMQLDYHHADYQRAVANIQSATYGTDRWDGNLKGIRWNNGTPSAAPQGYAFQYNRNNWLTSADYDPLSRNGIISMNLPIYTTYIDDDGNIVCGTPFQTTPSGNNSHGDYDVSEIVYDANGNIQHLVRRKNTRNGSNAMDDLTYKYHPDKPNQLLQVADAAGNVAHADDIGHQPNAENYVYNALGQLVTNKAEGVSYIYNASGLVTEVQKNSQPVVKFFYNDRNHRVKKESYASGNLASTTYYVRDLAGQVMAIYNKKGSAVALAEQPIYGLGRIGVAYNSTNNTKRYVYELTDHLGNVRATFTKNNNQEAQREGYTDYYPFGMPMPGRNLVGDYRYAFQGQEKDPETGKEAFELRLWDSRIGRWLSPDPYGQYVSPYLGMGNNPISRWDPDGGCDQPDSNCGWFKRLFYSKEQAADWDWWQETGFNGYALDEVEVSALSYDTMREMLTDNFRFEQIINETGGTVNWTDSRLEAVASVFQFAIPNAPNIPRFKISEVSSKFNLNTPSSFSGANPTKIKSYLKGQGWKITNLKRGKPGFRATNPTNPSDVIQINTGNAPKLQSGTNIDLVKQGAYMNRNHLGWKRVPLKGNPSL